MKTKQNKRYRKKNVTKKNKGGGTGIEVFKEGFEKIKKVGKEALTNAATNATNVVKTTAIKTFNTGMNVAQNTPYGRIASLATNKLAEQNNEDDAPIENQYENNDEVKPQDNPMVVSKTRAIQTAEIVSPDVQTTKEMPLEVPTQTPVGVDSKQEKDKYDVLIYFKDVELLQYRSLKNLKSYITKIIASPSTIQIDETSPCIVSSSNKMKPNFVVVDYNNNNEDGTIQELIDAVIIANSNK
jgi:hypothetical protein